VITAWIWLQDYFGQILKLAHERRIFNRLKLAVHLEISKIGHPHNLKTSRLKCRRRYTFIGSCS
jgi:hypothetical protein